MSIKAIAYQVTYESLWTSQTDFKLVTNKEVISKSSQETIKYDIPGTLLIPINLYYG